MSTPSDNDSRLEAAAASDESIRQVHAQLQGRRPEKAHGYSKTPLVLLGVMCIAVFFGSIYVAHYSIRFDPLVVNEYANRAKPGAPKAVVVTAAMRGKRVYTQVCLACHQQNGLGLPGVYPPLVGSEWVAGTEERTIRIVLHGLSGPIQVAGKDFNNVMAPLGAALNDQQIADVLSYVRQEWGNTGPEVAVETVARVRAATADRRAPWTAPELLAIGN